MRISPRKRSKNGFEKDNARDCFLNFVAACFFFFLVTPVSALENQGAAPPQPILSPQCNVFTFDATKSYDQDNQGISFLWDLGDGTQSRDPMVIHTYKAPGDYPVILSVTDNTGLENSVSQSTTVVRVLTPPPAEFRAAGEACRGQPIQFQAKSSQEKRPYNVSWDFGDGTNSMGQSQLRKVFDKGGTYTVTLRVEDPTVTQCGVGMFKKKIQILDAPRAEAGGNKIYYCLENGQDTTVSFKAAEQEGSDKEKKITYFWIFGDGKQLSGREVSHRFPGPGTYETQLIVRDHRQERCHTSVDLISVVINPPPKAHAGPDMSACTGQEVNFDGEASYVSRKGTAQATWDFGDGTKAEGIRVRHAYQQSGRYKASLTVQDLLNPECPTSTDEREVTVTQKPEVTIKAAASACLGQDVVLHAETQPGKGAPLQYYWNFGDGMIRPGNAAETHQFSQAGNYEVTVVVDDGLKTACSSNMAAHQIEVNSAPLAKAAVPVTCCAGSGIAFDGRGSKDPEGDNLYYRWDFGDGTSSIKPQGKYTYAKSGSYNVRLTVDDGSKAECSQSSVSFAVEINTAPVAVINVK